MATYAVPEEKLTAIADEIRLKRDIVTELTLDDMALQIPLIDGGSGGVVSGTYIPENVSSTITISDFIGKDNWILWANFALTPFPTERRELALVYIGGKFVYSGSDNSGKTGFVSAACTLTDTLTVYFTFNKNTGTITRNGVAANYKGDFIVAEYKYFAW